MLWDPADSEPDDTDTVISDQGADDTLPLGENGPEVEEKEGETTLPSKEAIIKQFGEEFGRDILSYLQQRTQLPKAKPGKKELWNAPVDEDTIFARAKELWKKYREREPSPDRPSRTFDKASFERAVFGMEVTRAPTRKSSSSFDRSAFEKAVFGQQTVQYDEQCLDSDDWTQVDEEEEIVLSNAGKSTTYSIDRTSLRAESPNKQRRQIETPSQPVRTPSRSSVTVSERKGLAAKGKENSQGKVMSGLIIAPSDEEDDYLDSTPAIMSAKGSIISISSVTPESSPLIKSAQRSVISISSAAPSSGREKRLSSPLRTKSQHFGIMNDDDDEEEDNDDDDDDDDDVIIIEKRNDTKGLKCGDPGYRCTKAFCFTCVA